MLAAVLLLIVTQDGRTAHVDTRGHELRALQLGLEQQLDALEDCAVETPAEPRVIVSPRSVITVNLVVDFVGVVVTAKVEDPGRFEARCLERVLVRARFAPLPRDAKGVQTHLTAQLGCSNNRCRWSWMERPDEAAMETLFAVSRSWRAPSSSTTFVFAADGGVATSGDRAGRWRLSGRQVHVALDEPDGGRSNVEFVVEDGGLVSARESLVPGSVELVEDVRLRGGVACDEACPPRQLCLALQAKCRKATCPLVSRCVFE